MQVAVHSYLEVLASKLGTVATGHRGLVAMSDGFYQVLPSAGVNRLLIDTDMSEMRTDWAQNGFDNQTDSTISIVDATRVFSIAPVSSSYNFLNDGVKYTKTTTDNLTIANVEGIHLIRYNQGILEDVPTPSIADIHVSIKSRALVSILYWDVTNQETIYFGEERHGNSMSPDTHIYLHTYENLRITKEGLGLVSMDVDGNGDEATAAQFGVDSGGVSDEDIYKSISSVVSTIGLPIYYMSGSNPNWRREVNAGYSVLTYDGTSATRLVYNKNTGGVWSNEQVSNNDFVLCHIFATTEMTKPMIAVLGQNIYTTKRLARKGATTEIHSLVLDDILFPEIKAVATVIFQTSDGYSNDVKARVVSTDEGLDYIDWRSENIRNVSVGSSDVHGDLSLLDIDDHLQYALLAGRTGGQSFSGGTDSGDNLTLQSTTNSTRGNVIVEDLLKVQSLGTTAGNFITHSANVLQERTATQVVSDLTTPLKDVFVPYTGATSDVNLDTKDITATDITALNRLIITDAGSLSQGLSGNTIVLAATAMVSLMANDGNYAHLSLIGHDMVFYPVLNTATRSYLGNRTYEWDYAYFVNTYISGGLFDRGGSDGDANDILTSTGSAIEWQSLADLGIEDNYADSLAFSTSTGVLTIGRTGSLADLTQDLDGRYSLDSHTHSNYLLNTTDTLSGNLTVTGYAYSGGFRNQAANTGYNLFLRTATEASYTMYVQKVDSESSSSTNIAKFTYGSTAAGSGTEALTITSDGLKLAGGARVTTIETALTNSATKTPTSSAVYGAIGALGIGDYVLKAGDTMTGSLTIESGSDSTSYNYYGVQFTRINSHIRPSANNLYNLWVGSSSQGHLDWAHINFYVTGQFEVNNHEIWHAGNDGIGSGLDADLLDGHHWSEVGTTDYINAATFNTGTGVISMTGVGSAGATVDIDGRYSEISHKYHSFANGDEYYDSYSQGNYLRMFTETAAYDTFRFRPYTNVEYWDGSAWVTWAQSLDTLLDGREKTGFQLLPQYKKFRFEVTRDSSYPTTALFIIQTSWSNVTNTTGSVTLETYDSSWEQKDQWTFSDFQRGVNLHTTTQAHNGKAQMRVTIDLDWTAGSHDYLNLRRIMFLSNYAGQVLQPWDWDYNRTVDFDVTPTAYGNTIWHEANDGSGSGLDADLLDGHHWSEIAAAGYWTQNGTDLYYTGGNVGIGTSSPTTLLTLAQQSDSNGLRIYGYDNVSTDYAQLYVSSSGDTSLTSTGYMWIDSSHNMYYDVGSSSHSHMFRQNGVELMRLKGDGKLGIGTVSPFTTLDVAEGLLTFMVGADTNTDTRTNSTNKTARLFASQYDTSQKFLWLYLSSTSTANNLYFGGASSTGYAATTINFYTAANSTTPTGTNRMTINSAGNVGIGTTSPSAKLEVAGNVRITDLGGGGDMMVVADNDGDLSTQAIPTGTTISGSTTNNNLLTAMGTSTGIYGESDLYFSSSILVNKITTDGAYGPEFRLFRNETTGSYSGVSDELGRFSWWVESGGIVSYIDSHATETHSAGNFGTGITIWTTLNGESTPTERAFFYDYGLKVLDGLIINESGNDNDTRIESTSNQNMFLVDASANSIGINKATPLSTLDLLGTQGWSQNTRFDEDNVVVKQSGAQILPDASDTENRIYMLIGDGNTVTANNSTDIIVGHGITVSGDPDQFTTVSGDLYFCYSSGSNTWTIYAIHKQSW